MFLFSAHKIFITVRQKKVFTY